MGSTTTLWLPNEIPVLISTIDLPLVKPFTWWGQKDSKTGQIYAYTIERVRDAEGAVHRIKRYMHRIITGCPPELVVDHRDRNRLNNTRLNLRVTTPTFNNANRDFSWHCHSGYRGVYRHHKRWRAQLGWEGERLNLGVFDTPEEAARAYDAKAVELYGEFAWYNFPPDEPTIIEPEQIPF